jgi:putative beta-barrel porin BBP2
MHLPQSLLAAMAISVFLAVASPVRAQDVPAPEDAARFRFGPIRFTPVLTVTHVGVDTNVFNEADNPKQDTTAAFGPRADYWIKLGRARVIGQTGVEYFYFREYDTQRSFGTVNRARVEVQFARLVPFVAGEYINTRQRPGYEIDARARRTLSGGRAGLDVLLGGRTTLRAAAGTDRHRFSSEDSFLGASLSERLDRDSDLFQLSFRRELTPLTTWVVVGEAQQDRFLYTPVRDADGLRVATGFEFKPFALISGKGLVGYRHFDTLSPATPDYAGLVASADLAYVLRATRITGRIERDVTYSFEALEPYYLLTDVGTSVTQRLSSRWDVVGRAARQVLDYQAVGLLTAPEHTDRVTQWGGGVGCHLGEIVRVGVDTDYYTRRSPISNRRYDGWRTGLSITYGIKTP